MCRISLATSLLGCGALVSASKIRLERNPVLRISKARRGIMASGADVKSVDRDEYHKQWEEIWENGVSQGDAWDQHAAATAFVNLVKSGALSLEGKRAVVPGCGRGYDVLLLANSGADATGLEISETAVKTANDFRDSTYSSGLKGSALYLKGDFFHYTPEKGPFDIGYDYTFFCAIHPSMRGDWAKTWAKLITKGGELVTLIFPDKPSKEGGPPFHSSPDDVRQLLEDNGFECIDLHPVDPALSGPRRGGHEHLGRWRRL